MIDHVAGVSECNENSVILNSIINAKIESKKLEFNLKKCVNMHIGPKNENCQHLKVHQTQMQSILGIGYLAGKFTVEVGLILRDSIFVSKMLLNSEVWHSVTTSRKLHRP